MFSVRGTLGLLLCAAVAPDVSAQEPDHKRLLLALQMHLQDVAATAGPAVACVVVSRSEFYPKVPGADSPGKLGDFDVKEFVKDHPGVERARLARELDISDPKSIPNHGFAGGVVIDPAGYVLTPYHVIDGATRVYVFLGGGGSYADIHAADARSDLAVLKLLKPPPGLKSIAFADVRTISTAQQDANVVPGKLIVLMTNPYCTTFGLDRPSPGFGNITNVRKRIRPRDPQTPGRRYTEYGSLLEYDIKFNAGVTGGALLNLDGELVGLTNSAAVAFGQDVGPGYAMPMDQNARRIVEVLRRGEEVEYGFLGVQQTAGRFGPQGDPRAIVPLRGGAADLASMRVGDIITKVNGAPVDSFNDLLLHVGSALAGSKVVVTVSRGGRERDLDVILAKYRNDQPFIASVRPEPVFGLRVDYGSLLAQQLKLDTVLHAGVSVREVVADSPAAKQFKSLGDTPATSWLITGVNGTPVSTPAEFQRAARGQEKLKLTLINPADKTPVERELTIP